MTGPVGIAVAVILGLVVVFAALGLAASRLLRVFNRVADEIAEYSGHISAVQGMHEARMEQLKVERAERLGPELARIQAAYYRLQEAQYELMTDVYDLLLNTFGPVIEFMLDLLTLAVRALDLLVDMLNAVLDIMAHPFDSDRREKWARELSKDVKQLGEAFSELLTRAEEPDPADVNATINRVWNLQFQP